MYANALFNYMNSIAFPLPNKEQQNIPIWTHEEESVIYEIAHMLGICTTDILDEAISNGRDLIEFQIEAEVFNFIEEGHFDELFKDHMVDPEDIGLRHCVHYFGDPDIPGDIENAKFAPRSYLEIFDRHLLESHLYGVVSDQYESDLLYYALQEPDLIIEQEITIKSYIIMLSHAIHCICLRMENLYEPLISLSYSGRLRLHDGLQQDAIVKRQPEHLKKIDISHSRSKAARTKHAKTYGTWESFVNETLKNTDWEKVLVKDNSSQRADYIIPLLEEIIKRNSWYNPPGGVQKRWVLNAFKRINTTSAKS